MSGAALNGRRATRKEISKIILDLYDLKLFDHCEKYKICGSFRRGKPDSGDVDIVIIPKLTFSGWFDSLDVPKRKGFFSDNILWDGVQVDFFLASEEAFPTYVLTWTGSRGFNIMFRSRSQDAGYAYTRNGMYDLATNEKVPGLKTEKDIFNLIGLNYIRPEDR